MMKTADWVKALRSGNYPGQHLKYQAAARAEAKALVEKLKL